VDRDKDKLDKVDEVNKDKNKEEYLIIT